MQAWNQGVQPVSLDDELRLEGNLEGFWMRPQDAVQQRGTATTCARDEDLPQDIKVVRQTDHLSHGTWLRLGPHIAATAGPGRLAERLLNLSG